MNPPTIAISRITSPSGGGDAGAALVERTEPVDVLPVEVHARAVLKTRRRRVLAHAALGGADMRLEHAPDIHLLVVEEAVEGAGLGSVRAGAGDRGGGTGGEGLGEADGTTVQPSVARTDGVELLAGPARRRPPSSPLSRRPTTSRAASTASRFAPKS